MTERCPHCGHELNIIQRPARWEMLNSGLVRILIKAVIAVHRNNENRFHLQRDLDLSKTEYNNAQKNRYHGLIAHYDRENPKSGEWLITLRGGQFLRGAIVIPRKVLVQDNQVLDHSTEVVHINELKHKFPEFDPRYAYTPILMPQKVEQPQLFPRVA